MTKVFAQQGDTVELICYRHFGYTAGVTEQVYNNNPGLAAHGVILPQGSAVELPEIVSREQKKNINLWD